MFKGQKRKKKWRRTKTYLWSCQASIMEFLWINRMKNVSCKITCQLQSNWADNLPILKWNWFINLINLSEYVILIHEYKALHEWLKSD